ncbi:delta6 fatty acid desaturase [Linnemannia elongata]|nr:hypothetical protein BGZ88_012628 [Linnemannia elongata]KAH7042950.1 delta6 fatty acid desaturase [Linnemannia elongata]KAK5809663.1 delta6 fatty acid desaturase [Linnemannia elongata]
MAATPSVRTFTRSEILNAEALNEGKKDAEAPFLMIIDNKVYDVREFVPDHPGGSVILTHVGKDGTDVFDTFHPEAAWETLANFYVGDIAEHDRAIKGDDFAAEVRKLRSLFQSLGYYDSSKAYYAFKVSFNLCLWALSTFIVAKWGQTSTLATIASASILGLFWQQCGWLAHDFLHHQVFQDRFWGDLFGAFLGGVCQGFSSSWWKDKHNTHHAAPNVHGEDPDIDTHPLLTWSEHALEMFSDVPDEELTRMWSRFMVLNQTWFYFPILSFARLSWCLQSILFVLPNGQAHKPSGARVPISLVEQLSLAMHWTWYFATMFLFIKDPVNMIVYFLVSQAVCGNLLALVFSLNHNGMPVISKEEAVDMDFFTKQIITGRDVHPGLFANWFTGGLNYQIEHHLFPSMPRHNFSKIQPAVESLCKKYGVRYHTTGMVDGTAEVFARLNEVSRAASKMGKST